jgi:hypothetical protein
MGEKILHRRLQDAVEFEAEPAAERLRHDIGKAVARNDGSDGLAERRRYVPCERHRPVGRAADTGDRKSMDSRAIRPVSVGEERAHVEKRRTNIGRRIGVDEDDGAARVRCCREVERLQRMRA